MLAKHTQRMTNAYQTKERLNDAKYRHASNVDEIQTKLGINAMFLNYRCAGLMKRKIQAATSNMDAIPEHVGAHILHQSQHLSQEGQIC